MLDHITRRECVRDTMGYVIAQNLLLDLMQGGPDGIDLRQDVHAIAILIHHPQQAADLPFDPLEPRDDGASRRVVHYLPALDTIPMRGI